jgi:superfamily II DNA helicase RecQ
MVCIDETHCSVPWDNNYRLSYSLLKNFLKKFSEKDEKINLLFLSATMD